MSLDAVARARADWFAAPDLDARFAAVQALQQQAAQQAHQAPQQANWQQAR